MTLESLLHRDDIPEDVKGEIQLAIDDHKETNANFLKTKTRLEYLMKFSPAIIYSCEPYGDFPTTFITENVKDKTGHDVHDFLNNPSFWIDCIYPNDKQRVVRNFEDIVQKEHYREIYRFKHKDGSILWMLDEAILFRDDQGNPIEIVGYWTDITKQKEAEERLKQSEEQFRSLVTNIPAVAWVSDREGNTNYISPNVERVYGFTPEEIYQSGNQLWFGRIHPDDVERVKESYKFLFARGSSFDEEYRIQKKNKQWIWIHDSAFSVYEKDGTQLVYGVFSDITDHKKVEKRLRESEEKYRSLFENIPIGLYRSTPDHQFLAANPTFIKQIGLSSFEELLSVDPNKLAKRRNYERRRFLDEINVTGEVKGLESELIQSDGTSVHIRENARAIRDASGNVICYEGSVEDITNHVLAEKALRESEERYRSLVDNLSDIVVEIDSEGKFTFISPQVIEVLGYQPEEEIGKSGFDFIHPDDMERALEVFQEVLAGRRSYNFEYRARHKDGHYVPISVSGRIIEENDDFKLISILRNITHSKIAEEKLQRSEERYRMLFNESPAGLWELDGSEVKQYIDNLISKGTTDLRTYFEIHPEEVKKLMKMVRVLDINTATLKLYKANKKEDLQDLSVVFGEDSVLAFKELVLSEGRQAFEIETVNYTLDGDRIHVLIGSNIVPGYEEMFTRIIVSVVDITDRVKMISALRESEEKYRILFNESPISLWEEDFSQIKWHFNSLKATGVEDIEKYLDDHPEEVKKLARMIKVLDTNTTSLKMYNATEKQDLFKGLEVLFGEESYRVFKQEIISLFNGHMTFESDQINYTLDGERIYILLKLTIVPGYEDSWSRAIVSIVDITDRVEMERALRESEERLRAFMDSATDSFLLLDSEFNIIEANENFSLGWNFQKHEIIGRNLADLSERVVLASLDDIVDLINQLNDIVKMGGMYDREFSVLHPKQGTKYFSVRAFKVGIGLGIISRDITEQKEAELVRKELEQRRENFIYMASHELRTPLTVISGYCDFLDKHDQFIDHDRRDKIISVMKSNVHRLERLTEDVAQVAQIEKEQFQISKREFDLCDFLFRNLDQYNQLLGTQFSFQRCNIDQSIIINADPDRLQQVLENVISNAIKHTSKDKREITVKVELQANNVQIYISDNGAGITPEHLEAIFDQFISFQTDYAAGGTGIGLYLSRRILEAHGGTITAQSAGKGFGSTFMIELPK